MKPIQVTIDEALLGELDRDAGVRREGRSAVLRRLIADYLRRQREAAVRERYRRAYGAAGARELEGWADEASWPES